MASKLTADTVTDEQIRELMNSEASPIDADRQPWVAMAALGDVAACYAIGLTKEQARARCAEILNARAETIGIGARVVGKLDTGGELRGEVVALIGRLATVRTETGRTFTRSLDEIARAEGKS